MLSVRSVLRQDPRPQEIIVVDDGEEDPEPVRQVVEEAGIRFIHHRKDRRGISRSRNIGAELSQGELVMYLDDDEQMEPGYIRAIMDLFNNPDVVGAAGQRLAGSGSEPGRMDPVWDVLRRFFGLYGTGHRILSSGFSSPAWGSFTCPTDVEFLSGTATYRRRLFEKYKFDVELEKLGPYAFGEDLAFSYKIRKEGRRVVTPLANISHHRSPDSRPTRRALARHRLYNQYYIYSMYLKPDGARPLAFAWAVLGKCVLAALRLPLHPSMASWNYLVGTVEGTFMVARVALSGGFQPGSPDRL